jgi:hypothetical protein
VPSEPCTDASDRRPDDAEAGAVGGALTYGTILDQNPFGLVVAEAPSGVAPYSEAPADDRGAPADGRGAPEPASLE